MCGTREKVAYAITRVRHSKTMLLFLHRCCHSAKDHTCPWKLQLGRRHRCVNFEPRSKRVVAPLVTPGRAHGLSTAYNARMHSHGLHTRMPYNTGHSHGLQPHNRCRHTFAFPVRHTVWRRYCILQTDRACLPFINVQNYC